MLPRPRALLEINTADKQGRPAQLCEADLIEVYVPDVYLFRADMTEANATGANFTDGDMAQIDAGDATLEHAILNKVDATMGDFFAIKGKELQAIKATFIGANFARAILEQATLTSSRFLRADLQFTNMSYTDCRNTDFTGADCRYARFVHADLRGAIFERVNLRHADLSEAIIDTTTIFDGADMRACVFDRKALTNQQLQFVRLGMPPRDEMDRGEP